MKEIQETEKDLEKYIEKGFVQGAIIYNKSEGLGLIDEVGYFSGFGVGCYAKCEEWDSSGFPLRKCELITDVDAIFVLKKMLLLERMGWEPTTSNTYLNALGFSATKLYEKSSIAL